MEIYPRLLEQEVPKTFSGRCQSSLWIWGVSGLRASRGPVSQTGTLLSYLQEVLVIFKTHL